MQATCRLLASVRHRVVHHLELAADDVGLGGLDHPTFFAETEDAAGANLPQFVQDEFLQRPSLWRTTPLWQSGGGELFNVGKPGSSEPELWVPLRRLES